MLRRCLSRGASLAEASLEEFLTSSSSLEVLCMVRAMSPGVVVDMFKSDDRSDLVLSVKFWSTEKIFSKYFPVVYVYGYSAHSMATKEKLTFQIEKSKGGSDTIADFVRTDDLVRAEVTAIPGVGPATAAALSDNGINTM